MQIILIDTVGFIRRLPHGLINAFRSTLEEASRADLLLNILDASSDDTLMQYETTLSTLSDIGADNIPMLTVLNKIDLADSSADFSDTIEDLSKQYPGSVPVSAATGKGLGDLCARIEQSLSGGKKSFRFPPERTDLAALLHRSGQVVSEHYGDSFIEMEARLDERTAGKLKEYQIDPPALTGS
jgi:GTP-binding protein HflX